MTLGPKKVACRDPASLIVKSIPGKPIAADAAPTAQPFPVALEGDTVTFSKLPASCTAPVVAAQLRAALFHRVKQKQRTFFSLMLASELKRCAPSGQLKKM